MKRVIAIVFVALVITLSIVGGVAYYFTVHGSQDLEELLRKDEPTVLAERDLFITPPQQSDKPGIELFSPLPGAIYVGQKPEVAGRLSSKKGIVLLDGRKSYLTLTDEKGAFNFDMPIDEGLHTLTIFQFRDLSTKIVDIKTVPFAFFNSSRKDIGERLIMGEIMQADNDRTIKLSTTNGLQSAYVLPEATLVKRFQVGGSVVPISWDQIDHTDYAVVGEQIENGKLTVKYLNIDYYPYSFVAEIKSFTDDGFTIRRRGFQDTSSHVILESNTKYVAWGDLDDFYSISRENLVQGDIVFVSSYVLPTVDRPNYHAYQIIRLPVGSIP